MATPVPESVVPLSVLDVCPVRAGETAAQAIRETVDLARTVEALGFRRYWLAEHHNTAGIASSAPEVLITHVADATSTIRVGSGGIMLPNHSPLKVAETFRTLGAMFPDRIDLGIGRAPGTDLTTALALRRSREAVTTDQFPQLLGELLAFFDDEFPDNHPFRSVQAAPAGVDTPPLFLLGSSDYSANVSAQLGLGFAFARHINPSPATQMLRAYRDNFQPGEFGTAPYAILGISALCADTAEEAEHLAAPLDLAWLRIGQGKRGPSPSFEEALAYRYTPAEEAMRRANRARHLVGDAVTVAESVRALAASGQADEVMVLTMAPDAATRLRSYELLAAALSN